MAKKFLLFLLFLLPLTHLNAQTASCDDLPYLSIGQAARVTPGDPNNLRMIPALNGQLLGEIPGGETLTVLEGPVCADDLVWWRVDVDGETGWTAEGADGQLWLEPAFAYLERITPQTALRVEPLGTTHGVVREVGGLKLLGNHVIVPDPTGIRIYNAFRPFEFSDEVTWRGIEALAGDYRGSNMPLVHYTPIQDFLLTFFYEYGLQINRANQYLTSPEIPRAQVMLARYSPDGTRFAALGMSNEVQLWDTDINSPTAGLRLMTVWSGVDAPIHHFEFTPDTQKLMLAHGTSVTLWSLPNNQLDRQHTAGEMTVLRLFAVSRAERPVAAAAGVPVGQQGEERVTRVNVWTPDGGALTLDMDEGRWIDSIALSPDGAVLALASADGNATYLTLVDALTGERLLELDNEDHFAALQLNFDATGRALIGLDYSTASTRLWGVLNK